MLMVLGAADPMFSVFFIFIRTNFLHVHLINIYTVWPGFGGHPRLRVDRARILQAIELQFITFTSL